MPEKIKKFLNTKNIIVLLILIAAFVLRVFGTDRILAFHYDQGRDASVIWDLIHNHKFFLIGPTTGLPGIFRAPYYYYLVAPFYWLGSGNPVFPMVFLVVLSIAAILMLYKLGNEIFGKSAGVISLLIASFSFNLIFTSRWLSNPTPMLLLSMILVWGMIRVVDGKKWAWCVISFVSGLSLFSFGSSGEFFYFLAILIFILWQWKNRPDVKCFVISALLFISTFAPLVLFNVKHQNILFTNFVGTFGSGSGSFGIPTIEFVKQRILTYFDIFTNKIFQSLNIYNYILLFFVWVFAL